MKKFFLLVLSLAMIVSLAGCNAQPKMGSGNKVIATSGSEKMLLRDYLYTLGSYRTQNEYYFNELMELTEEDFKEYWNAESYSVEGNTMFDDLKQYAWESAKEIAVLYKVGTDRGFKYNEQEIKTVSENLDAAVMSMNTTEKTGDRVFYENYYVTKEEALEVAKIINVTEQLDASIRDSIEVTDADARAFYDNPENISKIEGIQKVTVAHILLEVAEGSTDEEKEAIRAQADEILARVVSGENFGELAAEFSSDPGSKDNNGEYVITRNESFVQEFMDWTFSSNVGDYGIVETSYGYHIMNLVSVEGFEEMIEGIKEMVVGDKVNEELDKLVSENNMEWTLDQAVFDAIVPDVYGVAYEGKPAEELLESEAPPVGE